MIWDKLRRLSDWWFLFLTLLCLSNALIADWRFDLVWDLLYARVGGFLFYLVHASSMVFVCSVALVRFGMNGWKDATRIVLTTASIAGIHEMLYETINKTLIVQRPVDFQYVALWSVVVAGGFLIGTNRDVDTMLLALLFMAAYILLMYPVLHVPTTLTDDLSLNQYGYAFVPNFVEVFGWFFPPALLLIGEIRR